MRLPVLGERGQSAAVGMQLTLIITLIVAIIIVYQLGLAGIAPTDNASDPDYDADARSAYDRTVTLAWAGIGLVLIAPTAIRAHGSGDNHTSSISDTEHRPRARWSLNLKVKESKCDFLN